MMTDTDSPLESAWAQLNASDRLKSSSEGKPVSRSSFTVLPVETLIIRGEGEALEDWRETTQSIYAPRRMVFAIPSDAEDLPEGIRGKAAKKETVAYQCVGMQCSAPLESIQALLSTIAGR